MSFEQDGNIASDLLVSGTGMLVILMLVAIARIGGNASAEGVSADSQLSFRFESNTDYYVSVGVSTDGKEPQDWSPQLSPELANLRFNNVEIELKKTEISGKFVTELTHHYSKSNPLTNCSIWYRLVPAAPTSSTSLDGRAMWILAPSPLQKASLATKAESTSSVLMIVQTIQEAELNKVRYPLLGGNRQLQITKKANN